MDHGARLGLRDKLTYSLGNAVEGAIGQALSVFLLFYVTVVAGLPNWLAGAALAIGLIVDAILDPLIGSASDGCRSKLGRRVPYMLAGLPLLLIFFVAIFSLPEGLSETSLFLWLSLLSVLLRVALSLFILPYQALSAELTTDYAERSSIMAWRWGFSLIGTLLALTLGFGIFFSAANGGTRAAAGYMPFAISVAGISLIAGLVAIWSALRTRDRQYAVSADPKLPARRVFAELTEVFRNPNFRVLFAGALILFAALGTRTSLNLHANTYFWRFTPEQTQLVTMAIFVGLLIGAPAAGPLLRRFEKRSVVVLGLVGLGAVEALAPSLRLMGLLPYDEKTLSQIVAAIAVVAGIMISAAAIAGQSMLADATDEHEHLFGARREGMYFAGWAFASKAALGVGALLAGAVLQFIDFPTGSHSAGAAITLSDSQTTWLGLFYGPGVGLMFLSAALLCFRYKLDAARHASIIHDLTARRAAALTLSAQASS